MVVVLAKSNATVPELSDNPAVYGHRASNSRTADIDRASVDNRAEDIRRAAIGASASRQSPEGARTKW